MAHTAIPALDAARLDARDPAEMALLRQAATEIGFFTLTNTALSAADVARMIAAYRAFFALPVAAKAQVDMAKTGANRGWGAPKSERVDPDANPDFKEVFDSGFELPPGDPWAARRLTVYAPNLWPAELPELRRAVEAYAEAAMAISLRLLTAIAAAMGLPEDHFAAAFDRPMALLRGNFYPSRPDWAGARDFGIAAHTDYGCLTLLASDGVPGLEVQLADGAWHPVASGPGTFVINFGEMLEMWSGGRIKATLHRVIGTPDARISVPLFFNPSYDTDVAPPGAAQPILAGHHLSRRYDETYVHLQAEAGAGPEI